MSETQFEPNRTSPWIILFDLVIATIGVAVFAYALVSVMNIKSHATEAVDGPMHSVPRVEYFDGKERY